MTDALFDLHQGPPTEPYSCTGTAHEHRWIRFGARGQRDELVVFVDADGHIDASEQAMTTLLREAGFELHDPTPTDVARARLRTRLHARLLATIPGRNTSR